MTDRVKQNHEYDILSSAEIAHSTQCLVSVIISPPVRYTRRMYLTIETIFFYGISDNLLMFPQRPPTLLFTAQTQLHYTRVFKFHSD